MYILEKQSIWCFRPWHKIPTYTAKKNPHTAKEQRCYCCCTQSQWGLKHWAKLKKLSPQCQCKTAPIAGLSGFFCKYSLDRLCKMQQCLIGPVKKEVYILNEIVLNLNQKKVEGLVIHVDNIMTDNFEW